jgi:ankyrin repeat protein
MYENCRFEIPVGLINEQIVESISRYQFPKTGKTRLMYAAMTGNLKRLNFIADLGARVNMTAVGYHWSSKWTALHFASQNGHTACVRSSPLRERGYDRCTE